jgi:crossover junction endodeoxyribonuclease RuvC
VSIAVNGATRILGIDPGSRITGYGIIDSNGVATVHVASGCIRAAGADMVERLENIFDEIRSLMVTYAPAQVAIERVFVHRNADSALKLGQARAAALCATFGTDAQFAEYAARAVKKSVVGRGSADKQQVQRMIKALLSLPELPAPDQADALAVALCHAHTLPLSARLRLAGAGAKGALV